MAQYINTLRINKTELTEISKKASLLTAAEKEVYLGEWEWQKGLVDWNLMSTRAALDLSDWLKCAKDFISKRNYDLLLDVFKFVAPLYFDSYDEAYNLSSLSTLVGSALELNGFVLERRHIISLKEKLELLLEENTIKAVEDSQLRKACASFEDCEIIRYYLNDLLEFTQQCGDEDVAIIYII